MSEDHHRVRNFVVTELPRTGEPLGLASISRHLNLSLAQVRVLVEELERGLFFLVRNAQGAVSWAFPVTVDETPHHLAFSTGERLNAA